MLIEQEGAERLYLVVETKSSLFAEYLRGKEAAKIDCGKVHFQALATGDNPAQLTTARNVGDLFTNG